MSLPEEQAVHSGELSASGEAAGSDGAIHPTAIVEPGAKMGHGVTIGPYVVIESGVVLGAGCQIAAHAQLLGNLHLGSRCRVGPGAVLGGFPQDRSFQPHFQSGVRIGADNDIREHVTIHRSASEGGLTVVGDGNFFMAGSHAGHDCVIGSHNTLANHCLLGGHVQLGDGIFMGGAVGVHQFVRVGDRVMIQGLSGISLDLPPFVMAGDTNRVYGLNMVGLRRAGFTAETRTELKKLYRIIYREQRSLSEALELADAQDWGPEARQFLGFIKAKSHKGVCVRSGGRGDVRE